MKVAIYAGMYKYNQDGATKTLYELVDTMLKQNIDVGVWAFTITPQKRKGLELYEIPSIPLPLYPEYKISLPRKKVKNQIKAFKPDVIHITVPDFVGISLIRFAKKNRIPVVISYHTDFPSYLKSYKLGAFYKMAWRYFKWFYNKSNVVLAPTVEMIKKLNHNRIKNVKLWNRGIHSHLYKPELRSAQLREKWGASAKKVILYSGRFVWYKDLKTFLDVYDAFKQDPTANVQFVLAGDGPIADQLKKRMPDAIFTNYLEAKELSIVYASSDLLLFPSTTETFGNVVLESLASGIPAVVSDEGGCKEIVRQSKGGLVAKRKDPVDFFNKCKELLGNEQIYAECRESGLAYAREQDWQKINLNVIHQYMDIMTIKSTVPDRHFTLDRNRKTEEPVISEPTVRSA